MLKQQRMVNAALETRSSHGMASNYEQRYPPEYSPNLEFSNKDWVKRETCRGGGTQLYNIIITVECILSPTRASPGCLGLGPLTPTELDRATCTYLYTTSTNRRYVKDKNDPEPPPIAGTVPDTPGYPFMIRHHPLASIFGTVDACPVIYITRHSTIDRAMH
jgi:hypothetical protein